MSAYDHVMSTEHDMSDLLARLHAAFDSHPILVSDLPAHETTPAGLPRASVVLADTLAALANAPEGGVAV